MPWITKGCLLELKGVGRGGRDEEGSEAERRSWLPMTPKRM